MSRRVEQVAELLKREISDEIREILPEEFGMVTIMDVSVTADLKEAKIYISCLEKEEEKLILSFLEEKTSEFRYNLGRRLKLRYTPKITFFADRSLEEINRIDELLTKIKKPARNATPVRHEGVSGGQSDAGGEKK